MKSGDGSQVTPRLAESQPTTSNDIYLCAIKTSLHDTNNKYYDRTFARLPDRSWSFSIDTIFVYWSNLCLAHAVAFGRAICLCAGHE